MSLSREVDLDTGHFVLDGTQLPPERGTAAPSPLFSVHAHECLLWPNGRPYLSYC